MSSSINVITREQELLLDLIDKIDDPESKKGYLLKLKETLGETPKSKKQTYDLREILDKFDKPQKEVSIQDLQFEINQLKTEVNQIKDQIRILEKRKAEPESDSDQELTLQDEIFLETITSLTVQNWYVKIMINKDEFLLETIALIDSEADLNCIQEGLIPTKYFEKTKEKLRMANGSNLQIKYKLTNTKTYFQEQYITTQFILVKDLSRPVILGTPFLSIIKPFQVDHEGISTKILGQEVKIKFLTREHIRTISSLNEITRKSRQNS